MPAEIEEQLIETMMRTFDCNLKLARHLFKDLMMCVKERDLVKNLFARK